MIPAVLRREAVVEFDTPERCFIRELSNGPHDDALSIAEARVAPGVTTRRHRLRGIAERYVILQGAGVVDVGDAPPQRVGPGDVVLVPPGVSQRIANDATTDLVFLALCTPRFRPQAYEDVDAS